MAGQHHKKVLLKIIILGDSGYVWCFATARRVTQFGVGPRALRCACAAIHNRRHMTLCGQQTAPALALARRTGAAEGVSSARSAAR